MGQGEVCMRVGFSTIYAGLLLSLAIESHRSKLALGGPFLSFARMGLENSHFGSPFLIAKLFSQSV